MNKTKVLDIIRNSTNLGRGYYNGKVVDISDPLQVGRIRVEIPELTEGIPKDKLPWYIGKQPFGSFPNSSAKIPPLKSEVVVEFPTDDIYNGIYCWMIISKPPKKSSIL